MRSLIGIVLLSAFCVAWAGEPVNRSMPAEMNGVLVIENVRGSVTVEGWNRQEVEVTGELEPGAERVEVISADGRVEVRVVLLRNPRGGHANLVIKAPRFNRLEIETSSAEVEVIDFDGAQRITTVSGGVTTASSGKELRIRSVGGNIKVRGDGKTTRSVISSMSGELDISGLVGDLRAKSVSGNVNLAGNDISQLNVSSTSGNLEIVAGAEPGAQFELSTMTGDANVQIRGDITGEYTLRSISGDIENCNGPKMPERPHAMGHLIRFNKGDGESEVRISTMSGNIYLCDTRNLSK